MKKNNKVFLSAGVAVLISGCSLFTQSTVDNSTATQNQKNGVDVEKEMQGEPMEDTAMKKVSDDDAMMMKKMIFQYKGDLKDVTKGASILGVTTGGRASGIAQSGIIDAKYQLLATFDDLPDPVGTTFYEGWAVRKSPFNFISTGPVTKVDGVYTNAYMSSDDWTDHDFYVLTLEPDDGDPAPADHIVEGTMNLLSLDDAMEKKDGDAMEKDN